MGLLDKLKNNDGTRRYQAGTRNESVFAIDKNHSLVEVITLLKYQAYMMWGSNEALEILLTIASIRECLLNDLSLNDTMKTADRESLIKELRNVDVKIGKVLRNFELLCEQYTLPNPLKNLEGTDALVEMKKLIKLDKEFYGNPSSLVITEEIYKRKSKELGANFLNDDEIYPLANIQLYDTMILLMLEVVQYDYKAISSQIKECVFKLRKLVSERKSLDIKHQNGNLTQAELAHVEDLALQMGEIKAFFDGVADESKIPNKLYYDMTAEEFWKKLSYMFEVLNSVPTFNPNESKFKKKEEAKKQAKKDESVKKANDSVDANE